jgi:DNA-binding transcriptional LysR family regulator
MLKQIDLSRTDLNLLVLFEAVMEERHVGRAAARLNLSPSAVSHGLGRLRRLLNDPMFLKTPKGVIPTARAEELADPIADILSRTRNVVSTAEPFRPATSLRRFTIGAPDGVSAVVLSPLLAELQEVAPGIDVSVVQLMPSPTLIWQSALADLDARAIDIAIIPIDDTPARFAESVLYEEDFVIAVRAGHSLARKPTLERFCAVKQVVVSQSGDPSGFIDEYLRKQGRSRRIALTVPNFLFALSVIAESDLIGAVPRKFLALCGARFDVVGVEPPLPLAGFRIRAVVPKVALMDAGLAWFLGRLKAMKHLSPSHQRSSRRTGRER